MLEHRWFGGKLKEIQDVNTLVMCSIEKNLQLDRWIFKVLSIPEHLQVGQVVDALVPNLIQNQVVRSQVPSWKSIRIKILRGAGLIAKDLNGKSDPYVVVSNEEYGVHYKSRTKKETLNPVWKNAGFTIDEYIEGLNKLHFLVKDFDRFGVDERLGSFDVYINKIPVDRKFKRWFPLENPNHNEKNLNVKTLGKLEIIFEKTS
eukprot:TRINITY_DN2586_c0_g1_i1.p1 TRINITY_DN2586_c0_g1~~TRINITY_DN2586_c0_g1_i1.p1  ORF type:complete len:203 (-),score=43.08 TRINITY_DN2586_c0_g1_i1:100-708(-)